MSPLTAQQVIAGIPSDWTLPYVLATRVVKVLAILSKYHGIENSGDFDAALIVEEIQRALDGEQT